MAVLPRPAASRQPPPGASRDLLLVGLPIPRVFSAHRRLMPQRVAKAAPPSGQKDQPPGKEAAKPQGPLIIAISIDQQRLKLYDTNGLFAETPVSTGMHGHPTPMGVFSVIQKHKLHHSNIYSGAPMPYMQRITWSGSPCMPACSPAIRPRMAASACRWPSPSRCGLDQDGRAGRRHARRNNPGQLLASVARDAEGACRSRTADQPHMEPHRPQNPTRHPMPRSGPAPRRRA